DKAQQHGDIFTLIALGLELLDGLRRVELGVEQHAEGMVDLLDALFAEAATLQAERVQTVRTRLAGRGYFSKRQHVLSDHCAAAYIGMGADAHKLMHAAQRADYGPLLDGYVAGHGRAVDQHDAVSHHGIVADVRVGHEQGVTAHAGNSAPFTRPTVDGDALADDVVIPHLQACLLTPIADVLRLDADGAVREEAVVGADLRGTVNGDV